VNVCACVLASFGSEGLAAGQGGAFAELAMQLGLAALPAATATLTAPLAAAAAAAAATVSAAKGLGEGSTWLECAGTRPRR